MSNFIFAIIKQVLSVPQDHGDLDRLFLNNSLVRIEFEPEWFRGYGL